jgi:hypothetical protein
MIPWAVRPSSAFEAAPVRLPGSLSMGGRENLNLRAFRPPPAFQAGDQTTT